MFLQFSSAIQTRCFPLSDLFFPWCLRTFARSWVVLLSISLLQEQTRSCPCTVLYVFPIPDPMGSKGHSFQHSWDGLYIYALLPFTLLRQILLRVLISWNLIMTPVALLWHQKVWFTDLLPLLVDVSRELPMLWNLLIQPHLWKFHRGMELLIFPL